MSGRRGVQRPDRVGRDHLLERHAPAFEVLAAAQPIGRVRRVGIVETGGLVLTRGPSRQDPRSLLLAHCAPLGFERALGVLLGPGVVGLAARCPADLVHEEHLLRRLVRRDLRAAVRVELRDRRGATLARLHDRGDPLAPPLVGHADHEHVEHVRVRLEHAFDLFGEDLLAAGVDDDRAAPEQRDLTVGLDRREVARDRVPHAIDLDERLRAALRVVVVAERDVAGAGDATDLARNPAR